MQFLIKLAFISSLLLLSACHTTDGIEGNYLFPDTLEELNVGLTKERIRELYGAPSIISAIDSSIWYYIYERYERKLKVLNKSVVESQVLMIKFDNNNVSSFHIYTLDDRNDILFDIDSTTDSIQSEKITSEAIPDDTFYNFP